jgi:hypothetical protein
MTMSSGDLRDIDWVLTNRITEWHREQYHLKNRGLKAHALAGGHDGGNLA